MTIIALPPNHDHLADALVRDLGFTRQHVDHELHEFALALNPLVQSGVQLANMSGRDPHLGACIDRFNGDWKAAAARNPEITRFLEAARTYVPASNLPEGDVVLTDVPDDRLIPEDWVIGAIEGRTLRFDVQFEIPEGGVVAQEKMIVEYVRLLKMPAAPKGKAKPVETVDLGGEVAATGNLLLETSPSTEPVQ